MGVTHIPLGEPDHITAEGGTYNFGAGGLMGPGESSLIEWHTIDGTAKAGLDYEYSSGSLGTLENYDISVNIIADGIAEGDETFQLYIKLTLNSTSDTVIREGVINVTIHGNPGSGGWTGDGDDNTISGGEGDETINGGVGNDLLTGGPGQDSFAFDVKLKPSNADVIVDFLPKTDIIVLDRGIFSNLKIGDLSKNAFVKGKNLDEGLDRKDRIVYDEKGGELYFDRDGAGGKNAKLFAELEGSPNSLSHKDFEIVA